MMTQIKITNPIRRALLEQMNVLADGFSLKPNVIESLIAIALGHRDVQVAIQHKCEDLIARKCATKPKPKQRQRKELVFPARIWVSTTEVCKANPHMSRSTVYARLQEQVRLGHLTKEIRKINMRQYVPHGLSCQVRDMTVRINEAFWKKLC